MKNTQEQLDRLPKWAQLEIKRLEVYTKTLEQKLLEFNGLIETNTRISEGLDYRPLPNNSCVEFKTGINQNNSVRVYVNRDGVVDVNTDSRMGKTMVIMPRAANSFYITFVDVK